MTNTAIAIKQLHKGFNDFNELCKKFTMNSIRYFLALICISMSSVCLGQPDHHQWRARIDEVIKSIEISDGPGGVIGVYQGDKELYARAFGYADIANKIPNRITTKFDIASCAKQFTAASIMLLSEQNKINLQQPIQHYFTEFKVPIPIPTYSLLTHTSGIHDFSELQLLARGRVGRDHYDAKSTKQMIIAQKELSFTPLSDTNYSNSNYFLLAELVQQLSQKSYPKFLFEELFTQLDINATADDISFFGRPDSEYALGYPMRGDKNDSFEAENVTYGERNYGAGGIRANLSFLSKWMSTFKDGSFGDVRMLNLLLQKDQLSNGQESDYARGLEFGTTQSGLRWVQHTGRSNSTSILLWLPDYDISIIALFNTQEIWAQSVTNQFLKDIVDAFKQAADISARNTSEPLTSQSNDLTTSTSEKEKTKQIPQHNPKMMLSEQQLNLFTGTYPAEAPVGDRTPPSGGVGVDRITYRDGQLQYQLYNGMSFDLEPVNENTLQLIGLDRKITLHFKDLGTVQQSFSTSDPLVHDGAFSPAIRIAPNLATDLAKGICGQYQADSLPDSIPVAIVCTGNKIFFQWGEDANRVELQYLGDNRFTCWRDGAVGMQANIIAEQDLTGSISHIVYEGHRVWGLRFSRITSP